MTWLFVVAVGPLILFHAAAFVLESLLWMRPAVYEELLPKFLPPQAMPLAVQAALLRVPFLNQGFYNLFLAAGALVGLLLLRPGYEQAGAALIIFAGCTAFGAGLVLVATTKARAGGLVQAFTGLLAAAVIMWNYAVL